MTAGGRGPDDSVWRRYGDPLVVGAAHGSLVGERVAVKDLYAVAGQRIGAGNPAYLAEAAVQPTHAPVVRQLLDAGADVAGIARTDEFAYSLAGTNAHYGTPPNPLAPDRISGGSSSGSASAVSLGEASIGLGTDTGGSIRVPAAYQGLFGVRTTHGAVSREGLLPLAPSFDTVGWLTRTPQLLARVGEVLLPEDEATADDLLVLVPELLRLASAPVAAAVTAWLPARRRIEAWPLKALGEWVAAFQTVQAHEAWGAHGPWVSQHWRDLGPDVRGRFERAATVTDTEAGEAREVAERAREAVRALVGDRLLVLPAAPAVAPHLPAQHVGRQEARGIAEIQATRDATLRLTCLAGLGGLPAVTIPLTTTAGLPCGVCLVGPAGSDRALLARAGVLTDSGYRAGIAPS